MFAPRPVVDRQAHSERNEPMSTPQRRDGLALRAGNPLSQRRQRLLRRLCRLCRLCRLGNASSAPNSAALAPHEAPPREPTPHEHPEAGLAGSLAPGLPPEPLAPPVPTLPEAALPPEPMTPPVSVPPP